jgi:putative methyltransferase (TIGR04325 family)
MIIKIFKLLIFKMKYYFLFNKFSKKFSSFKETNDFCNIVTKDSYANNNLNKFRLQRFKLNFKNLHNIPQPCYKFLIEVISVYLNRYKTFPKILDFGGGFGDGFLYLRNIFQDTSITYSIVEQKEVVELSENIDFKCKFNHVINFFSSIDVALEKNSYDLLFSSGTLQSLKDPYAILNKFNSTNVKMIGLTRNSFSKKTKYISQVSLLYSNGSGIVPKNFKNCIIVYPHTTIEEEKLFKTLNKFKINLTNLNAEPGYSNVAGIFKECYSKDILLIKDD